MILTKKRRGLLQRFKTWVTAGVGLLPGMDVLSSESASARGPQPPRTLIDQSSRSVQPEKSLEPVTELAEVMR